MVTIQVVNHTLIASTTNTSQFITRLAKEIFTLSVQENRTDLKPAELPILSLWPLNSKFGEIFEFEILNPHSAFNLDSKSGVLSLNPAFPLDREITPKLQLTILARSLSNFLSENYKSLTSCIQIEIEDINDCAPLFQQHLYLATVSEEAILGSRLLSVKALDADLGMSGVVRYALDPKDSPSFLEINKYDGRINIISLPNSLKSGAQFKFHVLATDRGRILI